MTYRPTAMQRLSEHIPMEAYGRNNRKVEKGMIGHPLLGNRSVNKPSQQQRGCVLGVVRAEVL
jgi:hypothetical protein